MKSPKGKKVVRGIFKGGIVVGGLLVGADLTDNADGVIDWFANDAQVDGGNAVETSKPDTSPPPNNIGSFQGTGDTGANYYNQAAQVNAAVYNWAPQQAAASMPPI